MGRHSLYAVYGSEERIFYKHVALFPIYDWEFYRDVLLSPQDFENGRPDINMEYITIGERTSMSDSSAFGKGTFRLNLLLPEREQSYTLTSLKYSTVIVYM